MNHSGLLGKCADSKKKSGKKKYGVISSGSLALYKDFRAKRPDEVIALHGYAVQPDDEASQREGAPCFRLSKSGMPTHVLFASDVVERTAWMNALQLSADKAPAVSALAARRIELASPSPATDDDADDDTATPTPGTPVVLAGAAVVAAGAAVAGAAAMQKDSDGRSTQAAQQQAASASDVVHVEALESFCDTLGQLCDRLEETDASHALGLLLGRLVEAAEDLRVAGDDGSLLSGLTIVTPGPDTVAELLAKLIAAGEHVRASEASFALAPAPEPAR